MRALIFLAVVFSVGYAKCPRNLEITVSVKNVEKLDQDSESDPFFKLMKGEIQLHESKPIKNGRANQVKTFKAFQLETNRIQKYSLVFADKDRGFMNSDDDMGTIENIQFKKTGEGQWIKAKTEKNFMYKIDSKDVPVCQNEGKCHDQGSSWRCECTEFWTGRKCETDVDECKIPAKAGQCGDHGDCVNSPGSFDCNCHDGWKGDKCNEDINECAEENVCQADNQFCLNSIGSYKCHCQNGWTGDQCDEDFDECSLNPCKAIVGSTCETDGQNSFKCVCPTYGCEAASNPDVDIDDLENAVNGNHQSDDDDDSYSYNDDDDDDDDSDSNSWDIDQW